MANLIYSLEEWSSYAIHVIPMLQHQVLLLKGDLGAGKTSFSQALLKQLGCIDEVSSPTYAIVNEYDIPTGKVFHFDLYRIKNIAELDDLGFEEYLAQGRYCIIEWPEIYQPYWPQIQHHVLEIKNIGHAREVSFE